MKSLRFCCLVFSYATSFSRVFGKHISCEWTLLRAHPASLQWCMLTFLCNLNLLMHLFCRGLVLKGVLDDPSSSARLSLFWGI